MSLSLGLFMLSYEQTEIMDIWEAYHRSERIVCGDMWCQCDLISIVNFEPLVRVVFLANVLIDFWGLFGNYVFKLKPSVKAGIL